MIHMKHQALFSLKIKLKKKKKKIIVPSAAIFIWRFKRVKPQMTSNDRNVFALAVCKMPVEIFPTMQLNIKACKNAVKCSRLHHTVCNESCCSISDNN